MPWETQHTFATDELVRAKYIKSMQHNLRELERPQAVYTRRNDDASNPYSSTTSASFADVSADYLQAKFTLATQRSVLLVANVVCYTSAGDTEGELGISIDGVDVGGGDGIAVVEWIEQPILYPVSWIAEDQAAGEHEFKVRHRRTAGTGTMNTAVFSRHWFYAVEI